MKKFASEKVFRNIIFLLLAASSALEIRPQTTPPTMPPAFQNPLKRCWEYRDAAVETFASDNEKLIISNLNGEIKSIDIKTLAENWKISIGSKNETILKINGGEIILISKESQKETAEETQSGNRSAVDGDSETNSVGEAENNAANNAGKNSEIKSVGDKGNNFVIRKVDEQTGIVKEVTALGKIDGKAAGAIFQTLFSGAQNIDIGNIRSFLTQVDAFANAKKITDDKLIAAYDEERFVIAYGQSVQISGSDEINQIRNAVSVSEKSKKSEKSEKSENPEKSEKFEKSISALSVNGNAVFLGDDSGAVFEKDFGGKSPGKILRTGGKISYIQQIGDDLLITSNDNFIYYYSTIRKKNIWKKRLAGRISVSPKFGKTFAAVTTSASPEILFIDLENGKTFNQISMSEGTFVRDFQIDEQNDSILILTDSGLLSFGSRC